MPYWEVPWTITAGIVEVFSLSLMQSRTIPVPTSTSTAGTRPLPSARTISRCETMPWMTAASWSRICPSWCGGNIEMMRFTVSVALSVWSVESTRWPVSAACSATSIVSASRISPTRMTSGSSRSAARRGQVELVELGDSRGDHAEDRPDLAGGEEHVDTEAADAGDDVGEVHLPPLGELGVASLAQEPARDLVHVVGRQHVQVVLILE